MSATVDLAVEESVAALLSGQKPLGQGENDSPLQRQAAVALVGRRATAHADRAGLMQGAASLMAETLDVDRCGVVDLEYAGAGGEVAFWLSATVRTNSDKPTGHMVQCPAGAANSLVGYALEAQHPIVVTDLSCETRFVDRYLVKQSIQAAIVSPLRWGEKPLGVVGVFSSRRRDFSADDVLLVASIAQVLETTLVRRLAEETLAAQQRMQAAILETVSALVLEVSGEGRVSALNRAGQAITGFQPGELNNRPLASALLAPEEVPQVQQALARVRAGESRVEFNSFILTKDGDRRRIAWSATALRQPNRPDTLICTGVDITDHHVAVEELEQTRQAAAETRRALEALQARMPVGDDREQAQPFERIPEDRHSDRRERPRRVYPYVQQVAPLVDGQRPDPGSFQAVRCRDISAGGFSFLTLTPPAHKKLVVAFGADPSFTYLAADVVHATRVEVDGHSMHLVGCRYTGRLQY